MKKTNQTEYDLRLVREAKAAEHQKKLATLKFWGAIVAASFSGICVVAAITSAPEVTPRVASVAPKVVQPVPVTESRPMTPDEFIVYDQNQMCKKAGVSLGTPCKKYHEERHAKAEAERQAELETEAQDSLNRINNPEANCSAVFKTCW